MLSILTSAIVPAWSLAVVAIVVAAAMDFRHARMIRRLRARFETREESSRKFHRAEHYLAAFDEGLDDLRSRVENDRYESRRSIEQINAAYAYRFDAMQRSLLGLENRINAAARVTAVFTPPPPAAAPPMVPALLPPLPAADSRPDVPMNLPVPVRTAPVLRLRASRRVSKGAGA